MKPKTNTKIDHEIIPKITTLFDGHKQNSDKLDRIKKKYLNIKKKYLEE